jgi:hypothetical protein
VANQILTSDDVLERRLDVLGILQNFPLSSANFNQTSLVFTTGSIAYPAPSKRVYVAYLLVTITGGTPPVNTFVAVGSQVGNGLSSGDWVASLSLDPNLIGYSAPYVFSNGMGNPNTGNYNPKLYGRGVNFVVQNLGINATPCLATFTAVGWCS